MIHCCSCSKDEIVQLYILSRQILKLPFQDRQVPRYCKNLQYLLCCCLMSIFGLPFLGVCQIPRYNIDIILVVNRVQNLA